MMVSISHALAAKIIKLQDKLAVLNKKQWESGDKSPVTAKMIVNLKNELAQLQFGQEFNAAVKKGKKPKPKEKQCLWSSIGVA